MRRHSPAARAMSWPIFAVRGIAAWFPIIVGRTDASGRLALWRGDGCLTAPLSGYCSRRLSRYRSRGERDGPSCRGASKTERIQPHFDSPTACCDRPGGGATWRVQFTGGENRCRCRCADMGHSYDRLRRAIGAHSWGVIYSPSLKF